MSDWNQPCCERCWIEREGIWDEQGDDDVLIGLRLPVRLVDIELEQCSYCGKPTFIGVYVRADPKTVPYPAGTPTEG
jgi:hypothetical protein